MTTIAPPEVNPIALEIRNLIGLGICYPERFDRKVFAAVPEKAIATLKDMDRLVWDYVLDDVQEYGTLESSRVATAASGEGRAMRAYFVDLPELIPKEPDEVLFDIQVAIEAEARKAPPDATLTPPEMQSDGAPDDFPADVMSGVAGSFAEIYSNVLEAPPQFFYFSFLTALGILVTGTLTLSSEIAPPTRLYTVLLGESGDDRKSTAIKKTIEFFRRFITEFEVCWGVGSAEGLQAVLVKGKADMNDKRVLLALDELKQFASKARIEGSVLLPCVATLFENNFYHSRTKSSVVKLENAHLAILAASTVPTYETMFSSQFADIGFLNRLWLVKGEGKRRFSIPEKVAELDYKTLGVMLRNVLRLANEVREMPVTTEARKIFDDWYLSLPQSIHARRLDTYALRLMPLLAINDMKTEVDADTVRKAIALCDHQLQLRMLYDPIDADNKIAVVEEKLRRVLRARGPLNAWALKKAVHVERIGLYTFETAKNNLLRAKELAFDKKQGVFFLQPAGVGK
jgi:hypothetical protein